MMRSEHQAFHPSAARAAGTRRATKTLTMSPPLSPGRDRRQGLDRRASSVRSAGLARRPTPGAPTRSAPSRADLTGRTSSHPRLCGPIRRPAEVPPRCRSSHSRQVPIGRTATSRHPAGLRQRVHRRAVHGGRRRRRDGHDRACLGRRRALLRHGPPVRLRAVGAAPRQASCGSIPGTAMCCRPRWVGSSGRPCRRARRARAVPWGVG